MADNSQNMEDTLKKMAIQRRLRAVSTDWQQNKDNMQQEAVKQAYAAFGPNVDPEIAGRYIKDKMDAEKMRRLKFIFDAKGINSEIGSKGNPNVLWDDDGDN